MPVKRIGSCAVSHETKRDSTVMLLALVDVGPPAESGITVEFLAQNLEFITIGLWRNLLVSGYS